MTLTSEQVARIEKILKQWHEARRQEFEHDYSNLDYDSPHYAKTYRVGGKYVHLLDGSSGAFMVEIATGIVYEIQGWGVPNKKKIAGEAWKSTFHGAQLHDCRYIRGSYDNRPHIWVPTWETRVRELEAEGLTRSDAQAVVDAEDSKAVRP